MELRSSSGQKEDDPQYRQCSLQLEEAATAEDVLAGEELEERRDPARRHVRLPHFVVAIRIPRVPPDKKSKLLVSTYCDTIKWLPLVLFDASVNRHLESQIMFSPKTRFPGG